MKSLFELIEDCKLNEPVDGQELRYAVIALTTLLNMASSKLMRFCTKDISSLDKMQIENFFNANRSAINKSPKDWLGWDNDPANPEYQSFHKMATNIVDKAIKGELPNQKERKQND